MPDLERGKYPKLLLLNNYYRCREMLLIENKNTILEILFKKLLKVFSGIFIIELILGFNGKLLLIGDMPIRRILFIAIALILLFITIHTINKEKTVLFNLKSERFIFKLFNQFDYALAAFLFLNLIWIFIVPNISGYGIKMAVKQTISLNYLWLYYPIIILVRLNYIDWKEIHKIIKTSIFVLAVLHIFLYLGEIIVQDASFALNFFMFIKKITFGHSQRPIIMYPKYYFKIIYPTSIFLIFVLYYTIKSNFTLKSILFYVVGLTALFATLTKSLWFGISGGMLVFFIYNIILYRKHGITFNYHKTFMFILITIVSSFLLNFLVFDDYVFTRLKNSFVVQKSPQETQQTMSSKLNNLTEKDFLDTQELAGTERANFTRVHQTKILLTKWLESPWFGFGYGSYVKNYLRSTKETPYLYEMLLPSMLMHIGILGVLIWANFFIYIILHIRKTNNKNVIAVLYILIALGIATQFNPFLFGSSGMIILLFCFIEIQSNQVAGSLSMSKTD